MRSSDSLFCVANMRSSVQPAQLKRAGRPNACSQHSAAKCAIRVANTLPTGCKQPLAVHNPIDSVFTTLFVSSGNQRLSNSPPRNRGVNGFCNRTKRLGDLARSSGSALYPSSFGNISGIFRGDKVRIFCDGVEQNYDMSCNCSKRNLARLSVGDKTLIYLAKTWLLLLAETAAM